jgi:BASS family bile acid:Na+ symporter
MDVRDIIDVGIPVVVIFLMMLVRVTLDDFRPVLERPRLVGAALVAQLLVLPLLAGGMGWLAGVTPLALVALILIAACPAGVLSNVYTMVAGGNVALSVTLTAAGTLTSVVTIPLVTTLGFALVPGHDEVGVSMPLSRTATDLVFTILVPVGLGMAARPLLVRRPRLERTLHGLGLLGTLALVGVLLVTQWETVTGDLARLALAVVAFSAAALLAGDGLGRAMPTTPVDRVALALELPGRNLGVAAVVGVHSLGRPEVAALATAVLVVQVPLMFAASLVMRRVPSRPAAAAAITR